MHILKLARIMERKKEPVRWEESQGAELVAVSLSQNEQGWTV